MSRSGSEFRRFRFGPGLTPAVAWIIGIEVASYLLFLFLTKEVKLRLIDALVLTPATLADGHVWKLATTVLFHQSGLAFFFDILMLWMFVPILARFWGDKRFLGFFAATSLVGNVASAGLGLLLGGQYAQLPVVGISPFIYASITAYGVVYAEQPVQFFGVVPIKGKVLGIGMACFVAVFVLLQQAWVEGVGFFAAMALALIITTGAWTPNLWWLRYRRWRLRRRVGVIDGGRSRGGRPDKWVN